MHIPIRKQGINSNVFMCSFGHTLTWSESIFLLYARKKWLSVYINIFLLIIWIQYKKISILSD